MGRVLREGTTEARGKAGIYFSVKGQTVNILSFVAHIRSLLHILLSFLNQTFKNVKTILSS